MRSIPVRELARRLSAGDVSCRDVVAQAASRLDEVAALGGVAWRDGAQALAIATELDRALAASGPVGPLAEDVAVVAVACDLDVELRGVSGVLWRFVMMVGDVLRQRLRRFDRGARDGGPAAGYEHDESADAHGSRLPHPCYVCVMRALCGLWSWR